MKHLLGPASHTKLSAVINAWLMLSHSHTAAPAPRTCFKQPPLVAVEIGLQGPLCTDAKTGKKEQMKEREREEGRTSYCIFEHHEKKLYRYYVLLGRINKNKGEDVFWGSFWYAKKAWLQKLQPSFFTQPAKQSWLNASHNIMENKKIKPVDYKHVS